MGRENMECLESIGIYLPQFDRVPENDLLD